MNAQNEEIKTSCPHCGQHLVIDGTMLGLELECPMCKQPFSARRPETTSDPEPQFESDPPTDESESDQRNGPERFQGERESPPLPETHQTSWMKSKIAFSSAYVWTKRVFLRLPQRVQGAVLTAVVFLAGIAVFSWMGEPGPSNTSSQQPPRPDIKPLKSDEEASRLIQSCEKGDYKDIMRFPEKYKGKPFYVHGTVNNVCYPDPAAGNHRGNIWIRQDGDWEKEWVVVFDDERTKLPGGNMLKGDEICAFGTFENIFEWTGKNGFNATISGKSPVLVARLVSDKRPEDLVKSGSTDSTGNGKMSNTASKSAMESRKDRKEPKPAKDDKGGSVRDPINGVSGSQLHAKALCDEFVNGGSTVMVDGTKVVFWHSFGKPFTRINETTVLWDNGGENPPFLCEVVFSNDGTARLTQDNTFFAREFRRNSLNEISDALRRAFNSLKADDSGIRNATANVTADSHVLLSAEVSVSSGNVRESIGKAFFKMNCSRTLLRM